MESEKRCTRLVVLLQKTISWCSGKSRKSNLVMILWPEQNGMRKQAASLFVEPGRHGTFYRAILKEFCLLDGNTRVLVCDFKSSARRRELGQ